MYTRYDKEEVGMGPAAADVLRVASHPIRVKIASALDRNGGLTIRQLADKIPYLSEELIRSHLAIFHKSGIVVAEPAPGTPPDKARVSTRFKLAPGFRKALEGAEKLLRS